MGIEQHKALIQCYVTELNYRNLAILDELVATDVVVRSLNRTEQTPADVLRGREAYRAGILQRLAAFPDYQVTIVELLADGDQVMVYWTNQGTHTGPFRGMPATGQVIREAAISLYRIQQGQIVEVRGLSAPWDFWQQIDMLPPRAPDGRSMPATDDAPPQAGYGRWSTAE